MMVDFVAGTTVISCVIPARIWSACKVLSFWVRRLQDRDNLWCDCSLFLLRSWFYKYWSNRQCHAWFPDRSECLFYDKYRLCDRISFTTAFSVRFMEGFIISSYHFRTDKFESGNIAFKFRRAFILYRKRIIMRTVGNTIFVYGVVLILKTEPCIQRIICFLEM